MRGNCMESTESIAPVRKSSGNKLTAMMVVRNEAGRYLRQVLEDLSEWVDEIVILDDASDDDTPSICTGCHKVVRFERNSLPMFINHEGKLRARLWTMVDVPIHVGRLVRLDVVVTRDESIVLVALPPARMSP